MIEEYLSEKIVCHTNPVLKQACFERDFIFFHMIYEKRKDGDKEF